MKWIYFPHYTFTLTHACNHLQTRTIGMELPTEDNQFLTYYYSTVDIMWLFTTLQRTSPYTPNRGHGLNSIFTSFPSSCRPPRTIHGVVCPRSCEISRVSSFGGIYIPINFMFVYRHTHRHISNHGHIDFINPSFILGLVIHTLVNLTIHAWH